MGRPAIVGSIFPGAKPHPYLRRTLARPLTVWRQINQLIWPALMVLTVVIALLLSLEVDRLLTR